MDWNSLSTTKWRQTNFKKLKNHSILFSTVDKHRYIFSFHYFPLLLWQVFIRPETTANVLKITE